MRGSRIPLGSPKRLLVALGIIGLGAVVLAANASAQPTTHGLPAQASAPGGGVYASSNTVGSVIAGSRPVRQEPARPRPQSLSSTDLPVVPRAKAPWQVAQQTMVSAPWDPGASARDAKEKVVYLTFDDGPWPKSTKEILALLARYDAHATFFEVGEERQNFPDLVQAILAAGQRIGNHTRTHADLAKLPVAGVKKEIEGSARSACLRPPYGATDSTVKRVAESFGMRIVLWDVDPEDWSRPGVAKIVQRVMSQVKPGRIVLMHDGGGDRTQTVAALSQILPRLKAQGYVFHSLPC